MKIDITNSVIAFQNVVLASWEYVAVHNINGDDSYVDDWLQSNWERLVETTIGVAQSVALLPYGEGADCNPGSSRVWMPSALPTHRVVVAPLADGVLYDVINEVELSEVGVFSHFCSLKNGWPDVSAPFDYIALEGVEQRVVSAQNVGFWAEPL